MSTLRIPLPMPNQRPAAYIKLKNEPVFDANKHLQLEGPVTITTLKELGYDDETISKMPSELGVTTAFRVLSDEGLATFYGLAKQMENNKNQVGGTGKSRGSSYIRGAGYRSTFIRDLCASEVLCDFLSDLAQVRLGTHALPSVACALNYAPDDISKAVDSWHVDSTSFDLVMMLVDPATLKGGEFQYFKGTKEAGSEILGIQAEHGSDKELPAARVVSMKFPAAGYGCLQQGTMVFHRACRLLEKAERITFIPSFSVMDSAKVDYTNTDVMMNWSDPGMLTELARYQAWTAQGNLQNLINNLELEADASEITERLDESIAKLQHYSNQLKQLKISST